MTADDDDDEEKELEERKEIAQPPSATTAPPPPTPQPQAPQPPIIRILPPQSTAMLTETPRPPMPPLPVMPPTPPTSTPSIPQPPRPPVAPFVPQATLAGVNFQPRPPTGTPGTPSAPPAFPFPPPRPVMTPFGALPMPRMMAPGMPLSTPAPTASATTGTKRQAVALVSAEDWTKKNPGPVVVKIQVPILPEVPKEWNFTGQTLEFTLEHKDTVMFLKKKISQALGKMPPKKMKISSGAVFLNKDKFSLAHYNLPSGITLTLGVRGRGGKKKA